MRWSSLPPDEIERRRELSVIAHKQQREQDFADWYQEECDRFYWRNGRCCAGCDHWVSEAGHFGACMSAPPVSGFDVVKSLGWTFTSYVPGPGQPFTKRDHVCGAFQDDFDWSSLSEDYRKRIGAPT